MLGSISAFLLFLANFLYAIDSIVEGYGIFRWSISFWIWPLTFIFELIAILLFVILYKNPLLRYLAFGLFVLSRLIYSVYWMNSNNESALYLLELVVGLPYFSSSKLISLAGIALFLSTLIFVASLLLSFFSSSAETESTTAPSENFNAPNKFASTSINANASPGKISDIEVLG